jgi:hypothetical protein
LYAFLSLIISLSFILIIFGEKHQIWRSSTCNFLHLFHPSKARIVYGKPVLYLLVVCLPALSVLRLYTVKC